MHTVHERALEGETLKFTLEHAHLKGIIECGRRKKILKCQLSSLLNKYFIEPPDFASSLVRTSFLGWIINNLCHSSTNSLEYTNSLLDLGFLKYGPNLRSTLELIVQKSQVFPQIIC